MQRRIKIFFDAGKLGMRIQTVQVMRRLMQRARALNKRALFKTELVEAGHPIELPRVALRSHKCFVEFSREF